MTCRFCIAQLPAGREICRFHRRTLELRRAERCIWCTRSRDETDWPDPPKSYCTACLTSRIAQRGTRHRLSNALWRATA